MSDVLLYEISAEGLDLMIKRPVKKKRRGGREKRRKKKGWERTWKSEIPQHLSVSSSNRTNRAHF